MNGIIEARNIVGSANKLASALGIKRQLVDYWIKTGRPSPLYCVRINDITGVPLHYLRPDVYPPENANNAA